jgi:hypothetical protein
LLCCRLFRSARAPTWRCGGRPAGPCCRRSSSTSSSRRCSWASPSRHPRRCGSRADRTSFMAWPRRGSRCWWASCSRGRCSCPSSASTSSSGRRSPSASRGGTARPRRSRRRSRTRGMQVLTCAVPFFYLQLYPRLTPPSRFHSHFRHHLVQTAPPSRSPPPPSASSPPSRSASCSSTSPSRAAGCSTPAGRLWGWPAGPVGTRRHCMRGKGWRTLMRGRWPACRPHMVIALTRWRGTW